MNALGEHTARSDAIGRLCRLMPATGARGFLSRRATRAGPPRRRLVGSSPWGPQSDDRRQAADISLQHPGMSRINVQRRKCWEIALMLC